MVKTNEDYLERMKENCTLFVHYSYIYMYIYIYFEITHFITLAV